jgi:type IX secretion system PorP/SprF family membrane protein
MLRRNLIVTLMAFAFAPLLLRGQDPAFSQFYANPLYLNPALAGTVECGRLNLNYRNQWPAFSNAFITYSISYDQTLPALNGGFGVLVMADQQGDAAYNRTTAAGYYTYNLQVSHNAVVSFGVKGAFYQEKLNWEKLIFADQINPTTGQITPTSETPPEKLEISTADFGAGLVFAVENLFFAGFSADHLTQPVLSFYNDPNSKMPMKLTAHAGTTINLTQGRIGDFYYNDLMLQPNILYQHQGKFSQLNAGMYAMKYPFVLGVWFRHNFQTADAAIVLAGLTWNNFRFGYSFDISLSKVGLPGGGAHEISLAWDFCIVQETKKRVIRAINSPSF